MTLIEFLLARIAEDEESARSAPGPHWQRKYRQEPEPPFRIQRYAIAAPVEFMGEELGAQVLAFTEESDAEAYALVTHAVRWDPARVIDECAAKRQIVQRYQQTVEEDDRDRRRVLTGGYPRQGWAEILRREIVLLHPLMQALAEPYSWHQEYDPSWRIPA
jgi:hypothetical protein